MAILAKEAYLAAQAHHGCGAGVASGNRVADQLDSRTAASFSSPAAKDFPRSNGSVPCVHLAEMVFDPVAWRDRDLWVNSSKRSTCSSRPRTALSG